MVASVPPWHHEVLLQKVSPSTSFLFRLFRCHATSVFNFTIARCEGWAVRCRGASSLLPCTADSRTMEAPCRLVRESIAAGSGVTASRCGFPESGPWFRSRNGKKRKREWSRDTIGEGALILVYLRLWRRVSQVQDMTTSAIPTEQLPTNKYSCCLPPCSCLLPTPCPFAGLPALLPCGRDGFLPPDSKQDSPY